jgi:hypothetical protein
MSEGSARWQMRRNLCEGVYVNEVDSRSVFPEDRLCG